MKKHRLLILEIILLLGIFSLSLPVMSIRAESSSSIDLQAVNAFLEKQISANRIPGLAVAIVQGDKVIFQKGYGEASPGVAVTPQTQFYIGSVSKSFTALAVMKLVEAGKLELDTPVQTYLPCFQVDERQASSQITIRHLLNHTSGLSERGDPDPSVYTSSLDEQARLLRNVHLTAPVGTQFQYYNQNYRLLGRLIEQVSGQSFGEYLKNNIFIPLGMIRTVTNPAYAPELAQGYSRVFGFPLPLPQGYVPGALPSGYIISTAEDMSKFLLAQINNKQSDGKQLLQPYLLTQMRTIPTGIESEYGMGWLVIENGNTLAHGGALEYYQAFIAIGLKEKIGFVVLFNQCSIENMFFENSIIRDGLLDLLNGKPAPTISYGWIGWILLTLAVLDLFNHVRLFLMLPRWKEKYARQSHLWFWVKVFIGILFPLAVIIGIPPLVKVLEGGSPSWLEPLKLIPDLTVWLLLGMGLTLVRNTIQLFFLVRTKIHP